MAGKSLLPGFGGKYTSESIIGGTTGADVLDCSLASQLAFECTAHAGDATTVTIQQTFDGGTNWTTLTTFNATAGTIKLLQALNAGPFGVIRIQLNGTTGGNTITIVGFKTPVTS